MECPIVPSLTRVISNTSPDRAAQGGAGRGAVERPQHLGDARARPRSRTFRTDQGVRGAPCAGRRQGGVPGLEVGVGLGHRVEVVGGGCLRRPACAASSAGRGGRLRRARPCRPSAVVAVPAARHRSAPPTATMLIAMPSSRCPAIEHQPSTSAPITPTSHAARWRPGRASPTPAPVSSTRLCTMLVGVGERDHQARRRPAPRCGRARTGCPPCPTATVVVCPVGGRGAGCRRPGSTPSTGPPRPGRPRCPRSP